VEGGQATQAISCAIIEGSKKPSSASKTLTRWSLSYNAIHKQLNYEIQVGPNKSYADDLIDKGYCKL